MARFLKEDKRGQFSIEYLIAFLLFSVIILYVSFQAAGVLPDILTERARSRKDSEAHRIASFLAENEKGFAEEPYLWNKTKIEDFKNRCNNDYDDLTASLGLEETSGIRVRRYNGENEYEVCEGPTTPSGVTLGLSVRFGYIAEEKEINKLEVAVW